MTDLAIVGKEDLKLEQSQVKRLQELGPEFE
jgi:hypothetical protein